MRGEPASTRHRFCGEHGPAKAVRWRIDIQAAPLQAAEGDQDGTVRP